DREQPVITLHGLHPFGRDPNAGVAAVGMIEGSRSMSLEPRLVGWTRDLCDAALVLLVTLCLLTIALGRVLPLTGRTTLAGAGGSMEPAVHLGSAGVAVPDNQRRVWCGRGAGRSSLPCGR